MEGPLGGNNLLVSWAANLLKNEAEKWALSRFLGPLWLS